MRVLRSAALVVVLAAGGVAIWGLWAEPVPVGVQGTDLSDMVHVPAGSFVVGERRYFVDAFWIDRFEVTEADWDACAAAAGLATPPYGPGEPHGPDFPVRYVTHAEAVRFAAHGFRRLPTNLEWERACQGPRGQPLPWGSGYLLAANTLEAWGERHFDSWGVTRVGTFERGRSGVGAYDMIGNVAEWTADDFRGLLHVKLPPADMAELAAGVEVGEPSYVVRGGSFATHISGTGAAPEGLELGGSRARDLGFRCAISESELVLQRTVIPLIRDLGYRDPWNRRWRVEPARQTLVRLGLRIVPYLERARDAAVTPRWLRERIVGIITSIER